MVTSRESLAFECVTVEHEDAQDKIIVHLHRYSEKATEIARVVIRTTAWEYDTILSGESLDCVKRAC